MNGEKIEKKSFTLDDSTLLKKFFDDFQTKYKVSHEIRTLLKICKIAKFRFTSSVSTAMIELNGRTGLLNISISPSFLAEFIKTPDDLGFLLCHEISHYVLGHFTIQGVSPLKKSTKHNVNIAMDMVINHMLYRVFKNPEELFVKKFYRGKKCPEELMKPVQTIVAEGIKRMECKGVFELISNNKLTLEQALKHVEFHNPSEYRKMAIFQVLEDAPDDILDEILKVLQKGINKGIGTGGELTEDETETLKVNPPWIIISKIKELASDEANSSMLNPFHGSGVLPYFSRSDFVNIPLDIFVPVYHGNQVMEETEMGVKIYIDVSGSITDHLPSIFGLLEKIKDIIAFPVYGVSSCVEPITKKDMLLRRFRTTGGTDFNVFASHVLNNKFRRVVFITDGFGRISAGNAINLRRKCHVLTILVEQPDYLGDVDRTVESFSKEVILTEFNTLL